MDGQKEISVNPINDIWALQSHEHCQPLLFYLGVLRFPCISFAPVLHIMYLSIICLCRVNAYSACVSVSMEKMSNCSTLLPQRPAQTPLCPTHFQRLWELGLFFFLILWIVSRFTMVPIFFRTKNIKNLSFGKDKIWKIFTIFSKKAVQYL